MRILALIAVFLLSSGAASAKSQVVRDVSYGPDVLQAYDVYWDDAVRSAPVLVMLHGGAWAIGDKSNKSVWKSKRAYWGSKGYVVISVNTRLLPSPPDEQAKDFASALADIQSRVASWGGDPQNLVVMGHSAGAHIAALVGSDPGLQREFGVTRLRGVVVLDTGALDVHRWMRTTDARLYTRAFGSDPAYWRKVSPMEQMDRGAAPMLIVCSRLRENVCDFSRDFADAARAKGIPVSVLPVRLRHGSINRTLGEAGGYTQAVDGWMRQYIR